MDDEALVADIRRLSELDALRDAAAHLRRATAAALALLRLGGQLAAPP